MNRGLIALIPKERYKFKPSAGDKTDIATVSSINSDLVKNSKLSGAKKDNKIKRREKSKKMKKNKRKVKREVKLRQLAFAWKLRYFFKYNAAIIARYNLIFHILIHFFILISAAYSTWYIYNQLHDNSVIKASATVKTALFVLNYALPLCALVAQGINFKAKENNRRRLALEFAAMKLESLIFKQRFDSGVSTTISKRKVKHNLNQSLKSTQTNQIGKKSKEEKLLLPILFLLLSMFIRRHSKISRKCSRLFCETDKLNNVNDYYRENRHRIS